MAVEDRAADDQAAAAKRAKDAERTEDQAAKAADQVPYQQAAHVRQLLAERENAEAYGQTDRVAAVDKQLAELGVKAPGAKDAGDPRERPPEGRTAKAKQTTEAKGGK